MCYTRKSICPGCRVPSGIQRTWACPRNHRCKRICRERLKDPDELKWWQCTTAGCAYNREQCETERAEDYAIIAAQIEETGLFSDIDDGWSFTTAARTTRQ